MGRTTRIVGLAALVVGMLIPVAQAAAKQYVALGDSYASGVGSRVFYSESGSCKRSPEAYAPKIASAKGYTLNFEACSGAKTGDVNSKQLGNLNSSTSLVTLSIGGNDAGFSSVITSCALYFGCGGKITEANNYIANSLAGVLNTTYNNVKSRATTAKVIVLGYPHLFSDDGKTCNVNLLTSGNEKKLNETGDKLDAVVKAQAESHGFTFVDPRSAWKPHSVCASEEWLNGQSNPLEESYHPNVKGYAQFRKEVEAKPLP
jgi:lysophospholipase L1-like esterase